MCSAGMVCLRGICVKSCLSQDYICPPGEACDEEYCVETKCVGVRCDAGKVCRGGVCVAPCDGIACPLGQVCRAKIRILKGAEQLRAGTEGNVYLLDGAAPPAGGRR